MCLQCLRSSLDNHKFEKSSLGPKQAQNTNKSRTQTSLEPGCSNELIFKLQHTCFRLSMRKRSRIYTLSRQNLNKQISTLYYSSITLFDAGLPRKYETLNRLYGIYFACFLIFMIPFNYKLLSFFVKSIDCFKIHCLKFLGYFL